MTSCTGGSPTPRCRVRPARAGHGPTWQPRRGRSTPRWAQSACDAPDPDKPPSVSRGFDQRVAADDVAEADGPEPGSGPSLIDTGEFCCITWMNVWPTVSVTGFPWPSKNLVGAVRDVFFHVPAMVFPFVAIHAFPEPITFASSRSFPG